MGDGDRGAGTSSETTQPITLSVADRGILEGIAGSWRSASNRIVIEGANAIMRVSSPGSRGEQILRVSQISYPFMIAESRSGSFTIILKERSFSIYSKSLFPPVEYYRN